MKSKKIYRGDKICVIAPSQSMKLISDDVKQTAINKFKSLGLEICFGKNIYEMDEYASSSIEARLEDLHTAFLDTSVKGIITVIGGHNSNQLLNKLDYAIIRKNPKILCGFSDITALSNAVYARTGLITYYGPHFSTFGMLKGLDYTVEYFVKCLMSEYEFSIAAAEYWSDDKWYLDQENRTFFKNEGYLVVNRGEAKGTLVGGNLCTFNLLQGTDYMPKIENTIILMEEDNLVGNTSLVDFDRNLQSVIELKGFSKVKGILIGRFQKGSNISNEQLIKVVKAKEELKNIPIIANVNFGHTSPIVTLPIGGKVKIEANDQKVEIIVLEH